LANSFLKKMWRRGALSLVRRLSEPHSAGQAISGGVKSGRWQRACSMTSTQMYNWRVAAVRNALSERGKAEGPLTVDDLVSLGHLDQYHYLGVQACDELLDILGIEAGARVLDIGSGIGGPARYIAQQSGCDITGVELQKDLVDYGSELTQRVGLAEQVRFVHGDFLELVRSGSGVVGEAMFDHVISLLVILHFPERPAALQACYDSLKPGGTLLIEDFAMVGNGFTEKESNDLVGTVSANTVTSVAQYVSELEAAGFVDVHVDNLTPEWKAWTKARHEAYRESKETTVQMHGEKLFNDRVAFYEVIDSLFAGGNLGGARITARKMSTAEKNLKLKAGSRKTNPSKASLNEYGVTVATQEKKRPSEGVTQPLLPAGSNTSATQYHDSLQYHFFFPGLFLAGRVFHTKTLQQHSAWMFNTQTGEVTELFPPSYDTMVQATGCETLHLDSDHLSIVDTPEGGKITMKAKGLTVSFQQMDIFSWLPAGQAENAVIHRPNLACKIELDGKMLHGTGYSKRYYGEYPRFWGYRFIHGVTSESEPSFFWNADAAFGDNKYNYFKILGPSGTLTSAETEKAWQQDTSGYAMIDGVLHEVKLRPLATWETIIGGSAWNMESKMQNRYCEAELRAGSKVTRGIAYNERCYGTLG